MTFHERKAKTSMAHREVAKSVVHMEYADRLKLTGQQISVCLKKAVTYLIDNPGCDFTTVYGRVLGLLNKNGKKYPDITNN